MAPHFLGHNNKGWRLWLSLAHAAALLISAIALAPILFLSPTTPAHTFILLLIIPLHSFDTALFDEISIRETSGPSDPSSSRGIPRPSHLSWACEGLAEISSIPQSVENLLRVFCESMYKDYTDAMGQDVMERSQFDLREWKALTVLADLVKDKLVLTSEVYDFIMGYTWNTVGPDRMKTIEETLKEHGVDWKVTSCRVQDTLVRAICFAT
ncbi:hypothetical protein T440DRAFT_479970 [Plenodomus tracheiphilus IPT5]|uniref:Uncharacterized protein n=1 Tax=Plenodomus tracheiphilus IPT5 TaxID=1408161 RepID=A0A6A7B4Z5_9PLEO|nr:hypothetical protein T440DRAFT_479970 [Plenodomus tracheiphilus IPT5]